MRSVWENTCAEVNAKWAWHESIWGTTLLCKLLYLSGDIGNRCLHNTPHSVQVCISRVGCLGFLVHRAWRCEDMFECLVMMIKHYYNDGVWKLTETRRLLRSSLFHGSSGLYVKFAYKNTSHWSPATWIWPFISLVRILEIGWSVELIGKQIKRILHVVPVQIGGTEEDSGPFMIEAPTGLDIPWNMWS